MTRLAGYSKKPLSDKLGIRGGQRVAILDPPKGYVLTLNLGEETEVLRRLARDLDLVQVFARESQSLVRVFPRLKAAIKRDGVIWVSWPKKTSGEATDLSDTVVRRIGLAEGLVDVKVCAIDDTWSGLKFVRRAGERQSS